MASMMARVRGETAARQLIRSAFVIAEADVDENRHQAVLHDRRDGARKPAATVITSSPGLSRRGPSLGDVRVVSATRFADERS